MLKKIVFFLYLSLGQQYFLADIRTFGQKFLVKKKKFAWRKKKQPKHKCSTILLKN